MNDHPSSCRPKNTYSYSRCTVTQFKEHKPCHSPKSASSYHRIIGFREIQSGLRYLICRRSKALCRISFILRTSIPGKLDKPQVDSIKGIAPAIAIEQKVNTTNPRSTVGTTTEIYDYLKLLYARVGKTYSPISGKEVRKHTVTDVVDQVKQFPEDSRLLLLAPIKVPEDRDPLKVAQLFSKQGYARIQYKGKVHRIDQLPKESGSPL